MNRVIPAISASHTRTAPGQRKVSIVLFSLCSVLAFGNASANGEGGFDFMSPAESNLSNPLKRLTAPQHAAVAPEALPRSVAILPFKNATQEPGIAEEVRRAFYNQFSSKPYSDIELAAVDARVLTLERDSKSAPDTPAFYQALCQTLACDGVITGRVVDFRKIFAGVYSELAVSAEISLINAQSGEVVLTRREEIAFREGGLSLTPIGLAMSAMSAALNLRDIQRVRLVSELGYTIAKSIPDPLGGVARAGPRIDGMLSNAAESPFGLGKVITIAMQGDSNGAAVFDIGNYRRALPMVEKTPGVYIGEYRIQDGDAIRQAPLVATLRSRNGLTSSWYDTNLVNIDSQAPDAPSRLVAQSKPGQIQLRWDPLGQVSDLAGYQVLRSTQPLSGFSPIGVVQTPTYLDKESGSDGFRYYRVVALDHAGNASEPGPVARGRVLAASEQRLSGRIDADRELAGKVLVSGEVSVPAGVTLQIAPGTRIAFEPGAMLLVQGGLNSDSRDEPIEFLAQGSETWGGIRVDGGNIGLRGFTLTGATTGIHLLNARGILEGGLIQKCDTGLQISGAGGASAHDLRLSENQVGARLERSDAEITQNKIAGNKVGVELLAFSGVLRDNAIFQNTLNLRADAGTLLEANFWGSLDPAALRIEGGLVSEALNRPPPEGKVVSLRVSPCAGMTPEACQQKSAEAMIEGGRLFRAKNYGRALTHFETSIAAQPSADAYYFAAICHQEMQEEVRGIDRLQEGVAAFPSDPSLRRALGMLYFQRGDTALAREHIGEALRLSPNDRQAAFILDRLNAAKPSETPEARP
jgi:hypothetical protein